MLFSLIVFRLYDLQIAGHENFSRVRDNQSRGILELRRPRGLIVDARGEALAVSLAVSSVAAEPPRVPDIAVTAGRLAAALGMEAVDVRALLTSTRKGPDGAERPVPFVWIRRHVSPTQAEAVKKLALTGVLLKAEYDRVYPQGKLLAHVLGVVDIDDQGGEGLERSLDGVLKGAGGRHAGEPLRAGIDVDGRRRTLSWPELPSAGADVHLTIDAAFQRVVEEALDAACERHHPGWAVAVAMDPRTGAILALANRPTFDPSRPVPSGADPLAAARARQNLAVVAPYEPGSTWKPFAVAAALEGRLLTPDTVFDCEMGTWRCGARVLHDHHPYGKLAVRDIIAKSSNIGAAKIGVLLGPERLWRGADAFGFGRKTGTDLPLEDRGMLHPLAKWNSFSVTSVPMGHEISVTPLQLVAAMSAIANGGQLLRPYAVDRIVAADGTLLRRTEPKVEGRSASESTCAELRKMLREVVKTGTGTKADVPGLEI
ncbi:MAG TPA: penicillin-binding protein 2, partial [Planctomycetota bacterium]